MMAAPSATSGSRIRRDPLQCRTAQQQQDRIHGHGVAGGMRGDIEGANRHGCGRHPTYVMYLISGAKGKQANVLSADLNLQIFAL